MYYFFYHINTIALYWQEKSTILMNKNVRIDTPNKIVKCVSALTMKAYVESLQKQTMSPICNIQNSQWLHWYLPSEDIFQACCKSVSCWFSFSAWIHNFRFFFSYFGFLNVNAFKRYGFFTVLTAIIRKSPTIDRGSKMLNSSTWPSSARGEWRVSSWSAISDTR